MWGENLQRGVTFEIGNLLTYTAMDGKKKPAKYNPHAILVDWFAASCIAKCNPDQIRKESNLSAEEITALASISETAIELEAARIIEVDDPEFIDMVSAHAARQKFGEPN